MDIGSIFPLYHEDFERNTSGNNKCRDCKTVLYSLCREALYAIAERYIDTNKVVLFSFL